MSEEPDYARPGRWADSKEELETGVCYASSLRLPTPLLANMSQICPSVTHCMSLTSRINPAKMLVSPFLWRWEKPSEPSTAHFQALLAGYGVSLACSVFPSLHPQVRF